VHVGRQPGVRDHEPAAVQHEVARQLRDELLHAVAELLRLAAQLLDRLRQPVRQLHRAGLEPPQQLVVVVAEHAVRGAALHQIHDDAKHARGVRPAVAQVADEHELAPREVAHVVPVVGLPHRVPELLQQREQFRQAAVDVADDVERAALSPLVHRQRVAHEFGRAHLLLGAEHRDAAEAFVFEPRQRAGQILGLPARDVRAERSFGRPLLVAGVAEIGGEVEHHRHRLRVVLAGHLDERLAALASHVGRVDDREPPGREPLGTDEVQQLERVGGGALVRLVVGDHAAERVGRQDFRGLEVLAGEGGLAAPGRADEQNEGELGNRDGHGNTSGATVLGISRRED
jgi:hypothetical protein